MIAGLALALEQDDRRAPGELEGERAAGDAGAQDQNIGVHRQSDQPPKLPPRPKFSQRGRMPKP